MNTGLTGYLKMGTGVDLSYVFMPLSQGTAYTTPSNYLLSSGADLNTIFAKYTSGTRANPTGYLLSSGAIATPVLTITGAYTSSGSNPRIITFTSNGTISANQNISIFSVVVVGGGGGGAHIGSGGAGGGWGIWDMSYTANDTFAITVPVAAPGGTPASTAGTIGGTSKFLSQTTGLGVSSTGGNPGIYQRLTNTASGVSTSTATTGAFRPFSGGVGGVWSSASINPSGYGGNSSGPKFVQTISTNYGGGGAGGCLYGSAPGLNGIGATTNAGVTYVGGNATSAGSGGGGGGFHTTGKGGSGGPGVVVVYIGYP